jgi:hypothetical protein
MAFVPNGGGPEATSNPAITWVKLEYPEGGPVHANDVVVTPVTEAASDLGAWYGLEMGTDVSGAMLTAKIHESSMYTFVKKGVAPVGAGCCADTMRIYDKAGTVSDIDLESAMAVAFSGTTFAHATHTFDLGILDGELHAFVMVQYAESDLAGTKVDAVMAIKMSDGSIHQTMLGEDFFSIYQHLGTNSTAAADSIFALQYYEQSGSMTAEEWHGNGVKRFQSLDGTWILAVTQRFANGALLLKDPFTYSKSEGGGSILQRFGTPAIWDGSSSSEYHYFGVDAKDGHVTSGVHNLWHNVYDGRETLTMFVNGMSSDDKSHAFEFDVKLTSAEDGALSDEIFATNYTSVTFSYQAQAQGGARALGNGVIIGACGAALTGYEIVDASGGRQNISHSGSLLYDPFVLVAAEQLVMV